jgi:hypothetical protein
MMEGVHDQERVFGRGVVRIHRILDADRGPQLEAGKWTDQR